ncbi:MAG: HD domain-containing phosphohydrolase [Solirubrobacteraceae bacterium]
MAFAVHFLLAAGLVPAFILTGSLERPVNPAWLAVLLVAALVGEAREIKLSNGIGLDSTTATGLVALVLWGPLAAFAIVAGATVLCAGVLWRVRGLGVERRARLLRVGNLSNFASLGWGLLAGAAVLHYLGAGSAALWSSAAVALLAGLAASCCQLATGPLIHETLWVGYRPSEILAPAADAFRSELAMIALGALTVATLAPIGISALLLLAGAVALLALIPGHARAQTVRELPLPAATRLYARQLARRVGMSAAEQRQAEWVIGLLERLRESGLLAEIEQNDVLDARTLKLLLRRHSETYAAWTVSEHWDGSGPTAIDSDAIPRLASIVAVTEEWAALTSAGGPEHSHEHALTLINARAGTRHDPAVVRAAEQIVTRERRFQSDAAFQPGAKRALPALGSALQQRLTALVTD